MAMWGFDREGTMPTISPNTRRVIPRARRLGPGKLKIRADQAVRKGHTFDEHAHREGCRMPAAGGERVEQRACRALLAQMERLRVELGSEALDLFRVEQMRCALKALPDVKVFEVKRKRA